MSGPPLFHYCSGSVRFQNYWRIEHKKKAWNLVSSEPMQLGISEKSFRCHLSATIRLVSLAEAQCWTQSVAHLPFRGYESSWLWFGVPLTPIPSRALFLGSTVRATCKRCMMDSLPLAASFHVSFGKVLNSYLVKKSLKLLWHIFSQKTLWEVSMTTLRFWRKSTQDAIWKRRLKNSTSRQKMHKCSDRLNIGLRNMDHYARRNKRNDLVDIKHQPAIQLHESRELK